MIKYLILTFFYVTSLIAQGRGELRFELRQFENDHVVNNEDQGQSVFARVDDQFAIKGLEASFRTYARVDRKDAGRNIWEIEDLFISKRFGESEQWYLLFGYKIFNFTAMEAFHPADVINSRNLDSDFESFEKKGELTLELTRDFFEGEVSAYLFPKLEKPNYPGSRSRLGAGVSIEKPVFVKGTDPNKDKKYELQWGIKVYQNLIGGDLNIFALKHFDRSQAVIGSSNYTSFLGAFIPVGDFKFIPHYFEVFDTGITYQYPIDSFIFKIEALHRDFEQDFLVLDVEGNLKSNPDHSQLALGFEYLWALKNGQELIFIIEYQKVLGAPKSQTAELSAFQNDILFATRFVFNDAMSSELFFSAIADLERKKEYFYNLKFSRRLNDRWTVTTAVRIIDAPKKKVIAQGLETLDEDNYGQLSLTRFF